MADGKISSAIGDTDTQMVDVLDQDSDNDSIFGAKPGRNIFDPHKYDNMTMSDFDTEEENPFWDATPPYSPTSSESSRMELESPEESDENGDSIGDFVKPKRRPSTSFTKEDLQDFFRPRPQASTRKLKPADTPRPFPTASFNADRSSPNEVTSTKVQSLDEPHKDINSPSVDRSAKRQKTLDFSLRREALSQMSSSDVNQKAAPFEVEVGSKDGKSSAKRDRQHADLVVANRAWRISEGIRGHLGRRPWKMDRPKPPPSVPQPVQRPDPLAQRELAHKVYERELGIVPHALSDRYTQSAVADWRYGTADFCSTSRDVHINMRLSGRNSAGPQSMPFSLTACNKASLVLVGDDDGYMRFLDTDYEHKSDYAYESDFNNIHTRFKVHANAILDCQLSHDDKLLATASGDQSARITDVMTQQPINLLDHHTQTLKQVQFQPGAGGSNIVATCGRDGTIRIWDVRQRGDKNGQALTVPADRERNYQLPQRNTFKGVVKTIGYAHDPLMPNQIRRDQRLAFSSSPYYGKFPTRSTWCMSVTAIQFLPEGREHLLLSTCENESVIRLWDIRRINFNAGLNSAPVSYTRQPDSHIKWRPYGISSMCLNTDGSRLYAACRDSTVYAYSTTNLILGTGPQGDNESKPRGATEGCGPIYGFRHAKYLNNSFYTKLAIRAPKDGMPELLAVGSGLGNPVLFPTDEKHIYNPNYHSDNVETEEQESSQPCSNKKKRTHDERYGLVSNKTKPADGIPISRNGTALVAGHKKEVGGLMFATTGRLATMSDDKTVRCWMENRDKAAELRAAGHSDRGVRWNCGWADVEKDFDEVVDEW